MSSSPTPDFGPLAGTYDALRPADEDWAELVELLIAEASLLDGRVLDVGCGTGRLVAELARRGVDVAGVDPSPEMLAAARRNAPDGVELELAPAEQLPFGIDSFDRLVYALVAHLIDRPAAFAEARRVLAPGGLLAVVTFEPVHFDRYFLNAFFPSLATIDRRRFPRPDALAAELEEAGFDVPRLVTLHQDVTVARAEALRRIRGRHISTFHLLDEREYRAGLARAEAELPLHVETTRDFLLVIAERS
jgi:ubiquinone/menaquinone biosynthesis C-methylase UbiE